MRTATSGEAGKEVERGMHHRTAWAAPSKWSRSEEGAGRLGRRTMLVVRQLMRQMAGVAADGTSPSVRVLVRASSLCSRWSSSLHPRGSMCASLSVRPLRRSPVVVKTYRQDDHSQLPFVSSTGRAKRNDHDTTRRHRVRSTQRTTTDNSDTRHEHEQSAQQRSRDGRMGAIFACHRARAAAARSPARSVRFCCRPALVVHSCRCSSRFALRLRRSSMRIRVYTPVAVVRSLARRIGSDRQR
jgi:hypothetical protein